MQRAVGKYHRSHEYSMEINGTADKYMAKRCKAIDEKFWYSLLHQ